METPNQDCSWQEGVRRIWCSGPRPEYRKRTQRFNLPNRCIPLVRKNQDFIILPGGDEKTFNFATFCKTVLELQEEQLIFTSGDTYNLDDDVDDSILGRLKKVVLDNPQDKFMLVPYAVTPNFTRWAQQLIDSCPERITIFGESLEWIQNYGHKGILHRGMKDLSKPSVIECINPNIPVARGYYCETVEELLGAYQLLGGGAVVVKPVLGAAGEGIIFVNSEEELTTYTFPMGGVCLEEFLTLDKSDDGIVLSPAVHYMGTRLVGNLVDQIMNGTKYTGWRRTVVSTQFVEHATSIIKDVVDFIKPQGPGGFDFLSVGGKPVLTDVNTGRFNGCHAPKLFVEQHAPKGTAFYVFKMKPPSNLGMWQLWEQLQAANIAFELASGMGVLPMIYLPGMSGQFIALAKTDVEAQALKEQAEGIIKVAIAAQEAKKAARIAAEADAHATITASDGTPASKVVESLSEVSIVTPAWATSTTHLDTPAVMVHQPQPAPAADVKADADQHAVLVEAPKAESRTTVSSAMDAVLAVAQRVATVTADVFVWGGKSKVESDPSLLRAIDMPVGMVRQAV